MADFDPNVYLANATQAQAAKPQLAPAVATTVASTAAFDPDAYLKQKEATAFNPDTYIADKAVKQPTNHELATHYAEQIRGYNADLKQGAAVDPQFEDLKTNFKKYYAADLAENPGTLDRAGRSIQEANLTPGKIVSTAGGSLWNLLKSAGSATADLFKNPIPGVITDPEAMQRTEARVTGAATEGSKSVLGAIGSAAGTLSREAAIKTGQYENAADTELQRMLLAKTGQQQTESSAQASGQSKAYEQGAQLGEAGAAVTALPNIPLAGEATKLTSDLVGKGAKLATEGGLMAASATKPIAKLITGTVPSIVGKVSNFTGLSKVAKSVSEALASRAPMDVEKEIDALAKDSAQQSSWMFKAPKQAAEVMRATPEGMNFIEGAVARADEIAEQSAAKIRAAKDAMDQAAKNYELVTAAPGAGPTSNPLAAGIDYHKAVNAYKQAVVDGEQMSRGIALAKKIQQVGLSGVPTKLANAVGGATNGAAVGATLAGINADVGDKEWLNNGAGSGAFFGTLFGLLGGKQKATEPAKGTAAPLSKPEQAPLTTGSLSGSEQPAKPLREAANETATNKVTLAKPADIEAATKELVTEAHQDTHAVPDENAEKTLNQKTEELTKSNLSDEDKLAVARKLKGEQESAQKQWLYAHQPAQAHPETGGVIPGYTQIDEVVGGKNTRSTNLEQLKNEGTNLPFPPEWLPAGNYTKEQVESAVKAGSLEKWNQVRAADAVDKTKLYARGKQAPMPAAEDLPNRDDLQRLAAGAESVNSSNLHSFSYDPQSQRLLVKFLNPTKAGHDTYLYTEVPQEKVDEIRALNKDQSKGSKFAFSIRNQYPTAIVTEPIWPREQPTTAPATSPAETATMIPRATAGKTTIKAGSQERPASAGEVQTAEDINAQEKQLVKQSDTTYKSEEAKAKEQANIKAKAEERRTKLFAEGDKEQTITYNGEQHILTPDEFKDFNKLLAQRDRYISTIEQRELPGQEKAAQKRRISEEYSQKIRTLLGTLTPKEEAALTASSQAIRPGVELTYRTKDGPIKAVAVAAPTFGKVKIRIGENELVVPKDSVATKSFTPKKPRLAPAPTKLTPSE